MSNTEAALSRLIDEASIRDATARFADATTRGDYDSFRKLWSDAGEFTIGDPPRAHAAGVDDVVSMLRRLRDGRAFFVQLAVQGPIRSMATKRPRAAFVTRPRAGQEKATTGITVSPRIA